MKQYCTIFFFVRASVCDGVDIRNSEKNLDSNFNSVSFFTKFDANIIRKHHKNAAALLFC